MKILFPSHPLKKREPDPDFQLEFDAARTAGFECETYSLEDLRDGNATLATRNCADASSEGEIILHRGWMMSDAIYSALCVALAPKGYRPYVSPTEYAQAHYLPNAYPFLEGLTPESVWMEGKDVEKAWELYEQIGRPAAIVKDYVKSAKHRWNEACFIPASTGRDRFGEIIAAFLEARGNQFEKGIVLRRFHELAKLGGEILGHPVNGEYRLFMWDGALLVATPPVSGLSPLERRIEWESIARKFANRFISMDIARQQDGSWLIIEVGDGGVSGLPNLIDPKIFFQAIRDKVTCL